MHLDRVNYALCWEDPQLLLDGLHPRGRTLLSIGSGGENSLALLAAGANAVHLVEANPHQLHLLRVKLAAIRTLDPPDAAAFVGLRPAPAARRQAWAAQLGPELPPETRAWLAARPQALAGGLIHSGRFENYFRLFRRLVLPLAHGPRRVRKLLQPRDPAARRAFFDRRWNSPRWRGLFRLFFSRPVMARLGRSQAQFAHTDDDLATMLQGLVKHALTELDPATNPWLHLILTAAPGHILPPPWNPEEIPRVRQALAEDRLHIHAGFLHDVLPGLARSGVRHDGANLSDIFEYLDPAQTESLLRQLAASARPGARLAWWEMLVSRPVPEAMRDRLISLDADAAALHARDRTFFYRGFRLVERTAGAGQEVQRRGAEVAEGRRGREGDEQDRLPPPPSS